MQQPQEKPADDHILASPTWLLVVRIFQSIVSLIIFALAARLMHDAYLDEEGLALAIGLITWLAVKYIIFSERFTPLRPFYHVIAVLAIDGVLVILWLATFAAVAARRAKFKYHITVDGCFDDGSLFNSKTCFKKREELAKRGVILFKSGQAMLSAIAGLGALVWLLFIASFAWTLWAFLEARKQGRFQFGGPQVTTQSFQMEPKVEQQYQQQQQLIQQPVAPYQPQGQTQYPQQTEQYPVPYAPPQAAPYAPEQAAPYGGGQYPVQQQQYQPPYQGSPPPAAVSPPPQQPYHG